MKRKKILIVAVSDNPHRLRQQLDVCNALAIEDNYLVVDVVISDTQVGAARRVYKILRSQKIKCLVVSEPAVAYFFFRKAFRFSTGKRLICADTEATLNFFKKLLFEVLPEISEHGNTGDSRRNKRSQAQGPFGRSNLDRKDVAMTSG